MYQTSAAFIKGQLHGATINKLLELYKRELDGQNISDISTTLNTIHFSNDILNFSLSRYAYKYSKFSYGEIRIEETEEEYIVYLKANMKRLFITSAIWGAGFSLIALMQSGFNLFPLILGLIIFCVFIIAGYISILFFPVYFESLRNNIERELQEKQYDKLIT
jgi:hypothetical protein